MYHRNTVELESMLEDTISKSHSFKVLQRGVVMQAFQLSKVGSCSALLYHNNQIYKWPHFGRREG